MSAAYFKRHREQVDANCKRQKTSRWLEDVHHVPNFKDLHFNVAYLLADQAGVSRISNPFAFVNEFVMQELPWHKIHPVLDVASKRKNHIYAKFDGEFPLQQLHLKRCPRPDGALKPWSGVESTPETERWYVDEDLGVLIWTNQVGTVHEHECYIRKPTGWKNHGGFTNTEYSVSGCMTLYFAGI